MQARQQKSSTILELNVAKYHRSRLKLKPPHSRASCNLRINSSTGSGVERVKPSRSLDIRYQPTSQLSPVALLRASSIGMDTRRPSFFALLRSSNVTCMTTLEPHFLSLREQCMSRVPDTLKHLWILSAHPCKAHISDKAPSHMNAWFISHKAGPLLYTSFTARYFEPHILLSNTASWRARSRFLIQYGHRALGTHFPEISLASILQQTLSYGFFKTPTKAQ